MTKITITIEDGKPDPCLSMSRDECDHLQRMRRIASETLADLSIPFHQASANFVDAMNEDRRARRGSNNLNPHR